MWTLSDVCRSAEQWARRRCAGACDEVWELRSAIVWWRGSECGGARELGVQQTFLYWLLLSRLSMHFRVRGRKGESYCFTTRPPMIACW